MNVMTVYKDAQALDCSYRDAVLLHPSAIEKDQNGSATLLVAMEALKKWNGGRIPRSKSMRGGLPGLPSYGGRGVTLEN